MTLPKRRSREVVFQLLYSQDFSTVDDTASPELFSEALDVPKADIRIAHARAVAIQKRIPEIDSLIEEISKEYALERIGRIERNILRLASFELLYDAAVPPKVALSEAVRLARKYSTPESAKFVNGVLDALYRGQIGDEEGEEDKAELYWKNENPKK